MYAIYGNIYHQYTPNVSIYTIHGSYGYMVGSSNVPEMAIEWYTEQENKGKRFFSVLLRSSQQFLWGLTLKSPTGEM